MLPLSVLLMICRTVKGKRHTRPSEVSFTHLDCFGHLSANGRARNMARSIEHPVAVMTGFHTKPAAAPGALKYSSEKYTSRFALLTKHNISQLFTCIAAAQLQQKTYSSCASMLSAEFLPGKVCTKQSRAIEVCRRVRTSITGGLSVQVLSQR